MAFHGTAAVRPPTRRHTSSLYWPSLARSLEHVESDRDQQTGRQVLSRGTPVRGAPQETAAEILKEDWQLLLPGDTTASGVALRART